MLRLGIILTVTGVLALAHYVVGTRGVMPRAAELITAIALIVLGVPLLAVAVTRR